jgi:hypothetical protein
MSKSKFISIPPTLDLKPFKGLYNRPTEEPPRAQLIRKVAALLREYGVALDDAMSVLNRLAVILNGYSGGSSLYPVDEKGRALHVDPLADYICKKVYGVD